MSEAVNKAIMSGLERSGKERSVSGIYRLIKRKIIIDYEVIRAKMFEETGVSCGATKSHKCVSKCDGLTLHEVNAGRKERKERRMDFKTNLKDKKHYIPLVI